MDLQRVSSTAICRIISVDAIDASFQPKHPDRPVAAAEYYRVASDRLGMRYRDKREPAPATRKSISSSKAYAASVWSAGV